jgi:hypothetical protein
MDLLHYLIFRKLKYGSWRALFPIGHELQIIKIHQYLYTRVTELLSVARIVKYPWHMKERVRSIDGLKVETCSTRTESCPIATWFNTYLTCTVLGLSCDRPRTNRLSHIDIEAIYVRLSVSPSAYRNINTKQDASSGTDSDFPSESARLRCRDGTPLAAPSASFSGLSSPRTDNRTIRHL